MQADKIWLFTKEWGRFTATATAGVSGIAEVAEPRIVPSGGCCANTGAGAGAGAGTGAGAGAGAEVLVEVCDERYSEGEGGRV